MVWFNLGITLYTRDVFGLIEMSINNYTPDRQIGIKLSSNMLKAIDEDREKKNYATRSEYVRSAIRHELERGKE